MTGILPDALKTQPDLDIFLIDFYDAFLFCYKHKSCKEKPIRISDITAYSQLFPDINDNELLLELVSFSDSVCLDHLQGEKENGRNNKNSNP